MWGPDGWLYGRHGIQATSRVGRPGMPDAARTPIDCSIWRVHPETHRFEVVARGPTNPWGLDYDDFGEMIFTNNVIGHLWHLIPGAHYERMYGVDPEPHVYELMPQCADHLHWPGGAWKDSRELAGKLSLTVDRENPFSRPFGSTSSYGGHEILYEAGLTWLEAQRRGAATEWAVKPHAPPILTGAATSSGK